MKAFISILLSVLLAFSSFAGILFDGTDDFIDVVGADSMFDSRTAITIAFWIKPTGMNTSVCPLGKWDGPGGVGWFFNHQAASGGSNIQFYSKASGVGLYGKDNKIVAAGKWYHIGLTFDTNVIGNERYKLFTNGVTNEVTLTSSPSTQTDFGTSTNKLSVGRANATLGYYYPGAVSDVRVYDRALSASEMFSLAQARRRGRGFMGAGLIGYWPLFGPPSGVLLDGLPQLEMCTGKNGTGDNGAGNANLTAVNDEPLAEEP